MPEDPSNGYEAVAEEFMAVRSKTSGLAVVQKWAASLPPASSVVDVGAGYGEPLTSVLVDEGLAVSAIDAAPTMVAEFRRRFPGLEVACEPAERSRFFNRKFDAVMAIGLIFLMPEDKQRELIRRISGALKNGGRLLFSAPWQVGTWKDVLTGKASWSLGTEEYGRVLAHSGFRLIDEHDEPAHQGGTHYYEAQKGSV
ncbi:MAG TPA: class I SAM-dependent methyltransferase [Longimicrobiaceae bacterium]|nr:class I SAM-dependent methyltransferase [Longimicrobiaceae bacterium]